jgi:hypothetical protein
MAQVFPARVSVTDLGAAVLAAGNRPAAGRTELRHLPGVPGEGPRGGSPGKSELDLPSLGGASEKPEKEK